VCQCSPWDVVIPLFEKGDEAARKASQLLKEQNRDLSMIYQQEAVKYWSEALEAMKNPIKKEKPRPDPTLSRLQKMADEDRKPKPEPQQINKGNRPW
jgi:hypothetical protein